MDGDVMNGGLDPLEENGHAFDHQQISSKEFVQNFYDEQHSNESPNDSSHEDQNLPIITGMLNLFLIYALI